MIILVYYPFYKNHRREPGIVIPKDKMHPRPALNQNCKKTRGIIMWRSIAAGFLMLSVSSLTYASVKAAPKEMSAET